MTSAPALFDPGLQPERTALAWRRTALSIAVGSVVSLRLLPAEFGHVAWYAPGVAGVVAAGLLWGVSRRRHAAFTAQLADGGEPRQAGAGPLLAVAGFTVGVGVIAAAAVLLRVAG